MVDIEEEWKKIREEGKKLKEVIKQLPTRDVNICLEQFSKFHDLLMKKAPEGYIPWFFTCAKGGKNPATNGSWHDESARLTRGQAMEKIRQGFNIGISAREGDPLILIDIDEDKYLDQLPKNTLTATSRKRAGAHAFCWDKDGSAKINLPTDYGEVRSNNQYVLACGSFVQVDAKVFYALPQYAKINKLIGYYTVRDYNSPTFIDFDSLPQFFKDKENENTNTESGIKQREEIKTYEDKEGKYSGLFKLKVSDIVEGYSSNTRNGHPLHDSDTDANFSLSVDGSLGQCWRHLVSLNAVQFLCVKTGYMNCEDCGTPHKGRGLSKIKGDKKALNIAYNEAIKMKLISEWTSDVDQFLYIKKVKQDGTIEKAVDIDKVSEHIENKFNIRTIYGIKEETIEVYNEGIWTTKGKGIIKAEIEKLLKKWSTNTIVSEILEKIKRRTEIEREATEEIPNYKRCLINGVLDFKDINNIKLLEHSKDYNFRTKWNIKYDPNAKCEKYLHLVQEALYEQDIKKFQQWNALHLPRKYIKKKFAIYHGPKDTSKSVMLNHLTIALSNNVSGLTLQDISIGKPFDILVLKDKDANICDDLSSRDMKAVGGIKKSVGDGFQDGEMKFGDKIRFLNTAKQTYACNKIPNPGEDIDDEAYYGRIILIPFENVIPEEIQDEELINKITSETELSGWLNWIIEGYKELVSNNKFSNDLSPEETKYLMIKNGNSLAEFSAEVLKESAGEKISKEDLYKVYCKWCLDHKPKLSPDTIGKIGGNLTKFNPYCQASKSGSERYWLNLSLRDTWDTYLKSIRRFQKGNEDYNIDIYDVLKSVPSAPNNNEPILKEVSEVPKEKDDNISKDVIDVSKNKDDVDVFFNKLASDYQSEGLL